MVRIAFASTIAAIATLAAGAELTILNPSSTSWWVAKSVNVLTWDCKSSPFTNFTVLIANKDVNVLTAPLAFIGIQQNADCSKEITQQQSAQPAGTGYQIFLANPFNNTDIYAKSDEFEIKALGAAYPSSTPGLPSGTGAAAGSNSTAAPSSGSQGGGALSHKASVGLGLAAAGLVFSLVA